MEIFSVIRSKKKMTHDIELTPLVPLPPVRRILRCPTKVDESITENSQKTEDVAETSSQRRSSDESSQIKVWKLEEWDPRFGPLYGIDQPSIQDAKDRAWKHILKKSRKNDSNIEEGRTKEIYVKAIRKVESKAMEIYGGKVSEAREIYGDNASESKFRWKLIEDGCFFLQLALMILGCAEQLEYPPNDPIFGQEDRKGIKKWIAAMFYVGNQIPLVVLKELMAQEFFQGIITARRKWDPPTGLCKIVLYELLVLPALRRKFPKQGLSFKERYMRRDKSIVDQHCSDILHGIQNMVLGTSSADHLCGEYDTDDEVDLEANDEDIDDYGRNFQDGEDNVVRLKQFLKSIGFNGVIQDRKRIFPCATELKRLGIHIKKLKTGGVRSITFKSYHFWAHLYLPAFPVDDNTEITLANLKFYEMKQQSGHHRREVNSYIKFMSDIVQTVKDAKLLEKEVVLQGKSRDIERLPRVLDKLSSEDIRLTHKFHTVRRQIRDYSSPWLHYKGVVNIVVVLTVLQTVFTLLAYFKPPGEK